MQKSCKNLLATAFSVTFFPFNLFWVCRRKGKPEKVYPGHQRQGSRQHYLVVWFVLTGPLSSELAMWTSQLQIVATFARTVHPHTIPDNVNIYFSQSFYFGWTVLFHIPLAPYNSNLRQHRPLQFLATTRTNWVTIPWNNICLTVVLPSKFPWKTCKRWWGYHNPAETAPWWDHTRAACMLAIQLASALHLQDAAVLIIQVQFGDVVHPTFYQLKK